MARALALPTLEQYDSLPGVALLIDGGQHHGGGIAQTAGHRLIQPLLELHDGAEVEHVATQPTGQIFAPEILVLHCDSLLQRG
jgi:hypothetical protein